MPFQPVIASAACEMATTPCSESSTLSVKHHTIEHLLLFYSGNVLDTLGKKEVPVAVVLAGVFVS